MAAKSKEWLSTFLLPAKARKLRFQVKLTIHELTQYPILGELYVKWKDGQGGSGETRRVALDPSRHTCVWEEAFDMELKFLVDNDTNVLLPRVLHISVRQANPRTGEVKRVGVTDMNLSEFVASGRRTRAYILQECKVNCSIRLSVQAKQVLGDPLFRCPLAAAEQPESYPEPQPRPLVSRKHTAAGAVTPPPPINTHAQAHTPEGGGTPTSMGKRGSGSKVNSPTATEELLFGSAVAAHGAGHGHRVTMSIGELGRLMLGERAGRDSLDSSVSAETEADNSRSRAASATEKPDGAAEGGGVLARALNLLTLSPKHRGGVDAIGEVVGSPRFKLGATPSKAGAPGGQAER